MPHHLWKCWRGGVVARGASQACIAVLLSVLANFNTHTHSGKWERREEEEPDPD